MTEPSDPLLVEAMWRAADLTRAYLSEDHARIAACLTDVGTGLLERILGWLILDHDQLFAKLGEPTMTVGRLKTVAALAPLETEFATTTAIHQVATGTTGIARAVESLELRDQIHALTVCTVVMLLEAYGRTRSLAEIDDMTTDYRQRGYPRPYPVV